MTVLVLGASGMLGSMVADVLARRPALSVTAAVRSPEARARLSHTVPEARWILTPSEAAILDAIDGHAWVINAIGLTKPYIRDTSPVDVVRAIETNALLPHRIGERATAAGARVLQIATDGVYGGAAGPYAEGAPHDAADVYGQTKSLGETWHEHVHHLRCSIIGPEWRDFRFLVEWFRRQPAGAEVNGFSNHLWNGVTTLHFARLCQGAIESGVALPHVQHVVPGDTVSKAALLHCCAAAFGRADVHIADVEAPGSVDRRLATTRPEVNAAVWRAAGYAEPPRVAEMVRELAAYDYRPGR